LLVCFVVVIYLQVCVCVCVLYCTVLYIVFSYKLLSQFHIPSFKSMDVSMNLHDMLCLIAVCPNCYTFYLQYSYNISTGVVEGAAGEIGEIV
jgi:TRAP-type C4-dicarboxylate transport system permease small subunit